MTEKKISKNIWLHIMGVLILAEIVVTILSLMGGQDDTLICIGTIITLVFTALYGFFLYKKPHGNMLKYTMLLLAAFMVFNAALCLKNRYNSSLVHILRLFIPCIICYVAGRLNRIEQNKYLLTFATVATLVLDIIPVILCIGNFNASWLFRIFWDVIILITLMIAYFTRYKEHKEAGLQDA